MPIGRINLHSTSRMSLNDRFTGLQTDVSNGGGGGGSRGGMQPRRKIQNASWKNQRLAEQMESRPAVMAALRSVVNQNRRGGRFQSGGLLRGARGARGGVVKVGRGGRGRGASRVGAGAAPMKLEDVASSPRGRGGFRGRRGRGNVRRGGFPRDGSAFSNGTVKQRLSVQGRLSQPTRGGSRFSTPDSASSNFRGRITRGAGGFSPRGSYPSRTFRGRGRGSSRGRGSNRGGYWQ